MRIVACPTFSQQLDISSVQGGTIVQCPCGAQLKTPSVDPSSTGGSSFNTGQPHSTQAGLAANTGQASAPQPNDIGSQNNGPFEPAAMHPDMGQANSMQFGATPGNLPQTNGMAPNMMASDGVGQPGMASPTSPVGQFQPTYPHAMQQPAPASANSSEGMSEKQQLDFVNKGVMLVFYGSIAILASAVMTSTLGFVSVFYALGSLVSLAGKGAILVGCIFTLFAPPASNSKKFVIAALAVICSSGILLEIGLTVFWASFTFAGFRLFNFIWWLAFLSPEIGIAIYLFGLQAIADYTGQRSAADQAQQIAVHLLILCGVMLGYSVLAFSTLFIFYVPFLPLLILLGMLAAMVHWTIIFLQFLDSLEFRKQRKRKRSTRSTAGWGQARQ